MRNIISPISQFHHAAIALDQRPLHLVADMIEKPDLTDPYSNLKSTLIERITPSKSQRFRNLLIAEPLGDRRPSDCRRMGAGIMFFLSKFKIFSLILVKSASPSPNRKNW